MEQQRPLQALIAEYRRIPDFAELDLSDVNRQCRPNDDALIHLVAYYGGLDEMESLVASGARVNATGDIGYTPLHYAAMQGRLKTPRDTATNGGHVDIVKLFNRYK